MQPLETRIDHILVSHPDPLNVRESTAAVVQAPRSVVLYPEKIEEVSAALRQRMDRKQFLTDAQFGLHASQPQRIFLQDVVNFCFWAPMGGQKWTVEYPPGTLNDGWYGLTACFDRAIGEDIPILDAGFLEHVSRANAEHIFRGYNSTRIPLLEKRHEFLQEAGKELNQAFDGDFANLLEQASYDAPRVARLLINHFPSFRDHATLDGGTIHFYKRAQICAYDCSLLPTVQMTNLDELTVFADYKLPQLLRSYGVIRYHKNLALQVDQKVEIPKESREETEIRSATIWAGELIADTLKLPPVLVDNALWFMANETKRPMKPYHRTLTTNY